VGWDAVAGKLATDRVMTSLTPEDIDILTFERRRWKHQGAKDQAIKDAFDLSRTRYEQRLRALIHTPEAQAHDPQLVNRLLRLEQERRSRRAG